MSSSPSLTRWSSQAPRKISRRSQWTSERSDGPDELGPAVVDVLAQRRGRLGDLAVDDEVDQILGLVLLDGARQEAELARRLLAALAEVTLVEREPQLSVLEDEVVARAVVTASVHGRRDHMLESCPPGSLNAMLQGVNLDPLQARSKCGAQSANDPDRRGPSRDTDVPRRQPRRRRIRAARGRHRARRAALDEQQIARPRDRRPRAPGPRRARPAARGPGIGRDRQPARSEAAGDRPHRPRRRARPGARL